MTPSAVCFRSLAVAAIGVFLVGCAGPSVDRTMPPPGLPLSQESTAGVVDQTTRLVTPGMGAATGPAVKRATNQAAQAHYDADEFGAAIATAKEVLKHDPHDASANSILALSGLRLSTAALNQLRQQANLTAPLKAELKNLATGLSAILKSAPSRPKAQTDRCRRKKCDLKRDPFCVLHQSCPSLQGNTHAQQ